MSPGARLGFEAQTHLVLPGVSGLQVLADVKADDFSKSIPVVVPRKAGPRPTVAEFRAS